ncbi:MAG: SDR family oxidoreductase [Alphaproteobacteria bacterium]|nr:SDR family oxidoreductase [Alphaproteobacteria bacterium]
MPPYLDKPLKGRTAIVTGSGQNIGKAIALHFARAGANVVVNGRRQRANVEAVAKEVEREGVGALVVMADVADPAAVADMAAQAKAKFGVVDIAVSNVSVRLKQPFLDLSVEDWRRTLDSNLNSCFYLARTVIPDMKSQGYGRLIHISGIDGFTGHVADRAHNIVAKAGMHAFAKALSTEFGRFGITANTVAPGAIDTTRDWSQYGDPAEWIATRKKTIPVGRIGTVDEIAAACVYLSTDHAGFVTGQVIHVNGGAAMY